MLPLWRWRHTLGRRRCLNEYVASPPSTQLSILRIACLDLENLLNINGAPGKTRTSNPQIRRPAPSRTRVRQGLKAWLAKPASKFARPDAAAILPAFAKKRGPIGANHLMAYTRACFGWGIKADLVTLNPFVDLVAPGRKRRASGR
jgi:hypothetical protein